MMKFQLPSNEIRSLENNMRRFNPSNGSSKNPQRQWILFHHPLIDDVYRSNDDKHQNTTTATIRTSEDTLHWSQINFSSIEQSSQTFLFFSQYSDRIENLQEFSCSFNIDVTRDDGKKRFSLMLFISLLLRKYNLSANIEKLSPPSPSTTASPFKTVKSTIKIRKILPQNQHHTLEIPLSRGASRTCMRTPKKFRFSKF